MYNLDELLRTDDAADLLQRQIREEAPATFLRSIKVKIISNCNLRCEMCKYWRIAKQKICLLYTSPSPRDQRGSRMPSSA